MTLLQISALIGVAVGGGAVVLATDPLRQVMVLGIFGLSTGLYGLPHPEAWLFAGVVFAVISAAFMFDEHVHVVHKARRTHRAPFGSSRS